MAHKKIRTKSRTYLIEIPDYNPGVAKTNKHVRTYQTVESQINKLNRIIKIEDFAKKRAEKQKNDRLEKRLAKKEN